LVTLSFFGEDPPLPILKTDLDKQRADIYITLWLKEFRNGVMYARNERGR
jgi:hypothetical protein